MDYKEAMKEENIKFELNTYYLLLDMEESCDVGLLKSLHGNWGVFEVTKVELFSITEEPRRVAIRLDRVGYQFPF